MKPPNMVIWIVVATLLSLSERTLATTFLLPEGANIFIRGSELNLWSPLSFAFKTSSPGIILQQPEFINFQDFIQILLKNNGNLQINWRFKGQNGSLPLTSGDNTNLADNQWHVISFTYDNRTLKLKIDDSNYGTVTSLSETPSLFSVRLSQQDSRVVVGQDMEGELCFQTGANFGEGKFWIADGNVSMSAGSVADCDRGKSHLPFS